MSKILWWERSRAERLHRMLRNVAIESGCRCRYDDHAGQAEVRHSTTIPIASGEREFTRFDFQDLFERRALDIAQPDVAQETGTELRKVSPVCTRSWTFVLGEEEYFLRAIAA